MIEFFLTLSLIILYYDRNATRLIFNIIGYNIFLTYDTTLKSQESCSRVIGKVNYGFLKILFDDLAHNIVWSCTATRQQANND